MTLYDEDDGNVLYPHEQGAMVANEADLELPKPIVYLVDGELEVGTLRSYAECCKNAHYHDVEIKGPWIFHVHETPTYWPQTDTHVLVHDVTLEKRQPTVKGRDHDDYRTFEIELDGETASYTIDLRA